MVVLPLWGSPPGLRSCPCRWRRERWIWPCLRIPLPFCSMTFLEWPLSSLVNSAKRTKDYFVVQHCSRNFFTAFTASKWTSLLSIGETLPVVLVPLAFSFAGGVRLVFKCELIQVSVLFFCTPNCRLRFAIRVLFLKSFEKRFELLLFRFSQTLSCLMMILMFLTLSVSCSAKCFLLYDEVVCWQQSKLFLRHQSLLFWW